MYVRTYVRTWFRRIISKLIGTIEKKSLNLLNLCCTTSDSSSILKKAVAPYIPHMAQCVSLDSPSFIMYPDLEATKVTFQT